MISEGIDALITKEIGEIAFHMLGDEGVEIYMAMESIDECIDKFIKEKLKQLKKPTKVKE